MMSEQNSRENNDEVHKDMEPQPTVPGRIGIRHLQIFLMCLGMMIGFGLRITMSVAIVAMTKSETNQSDFKIYDWNSSEQSLILSSFFWGYILNQVPSGYLSIMWSAQKLLSIGLLVCSLFNILIPLLVDVGGWQIICACRFAMGLSQGCLLPGIQTLLARWVPTPERTRLATLAYAGSLLGIVLSMVISGQLAASRFGWPSIFYFFGILGIGWAILFYCLGSDAPALHSRISEAEKYYISQSFGNLYDQQNLKLKTPWSYIFTSLPMWALIIVHCGQSWGYWMFMTEIPTYMSQILEFNIKENGMISALPYLVTWILSFPVSWLSDYMLRHGVSNGVIRKICNTVAHWGPALALVALCFVGVENKIILVVFIITAVGLNVGAICGYHINHLDLSPNFAGTLMSITNCIAAAVALIAPIVCGWIITNQKDVHQWHTVFFISALIYFFGNLIYIIFGSGEVQWWNDPTLLKSKINDVNSTPITQKYKSHELF